VSVIGIDLGTSTVKAGLFSSEGKLLSLRSRPLIDGVRSAKSIPPGSPGIDADAWVDAAFALLRELSSVAIESYGQDPVEALSVSGNGPTLVAVDKDGKPLMPALVWSDRRALEESAEISRLAGRHVDPAFYLPKALRLMRRETRLYDETACFMPCPEYLAFRLTGIRHAVLPAPGYEPFIHGKAILEGAGLDPDKFPPLAVPGASLGRLIEDAAKSSGLPRSCRVAAGLPDFLSALLGSGVTAPGIALDRSGSSEALNLCSTRPFPTETLFSLPHPVAGLFNVSGGVSTSGSALDWLSRLLGTSGPSSGMDENVLETLSAIEPGSEGLLFLPYLEGERAPLWDPLARGAFVGLKASHGKTQLLRALLESVAFALRDIEATMEGAGLAVDEIRAAGGPSRNRLWTKIKADVLGRKIVLPESSEAEIAGSAAIALASISRFPSIIQASAAVSRVATVVEPDMAAHGRYEEPFGLFLKARSGLSAIHRGLSSLSAQKDGSCPPR
jgi:xylulokinase